VGSQNSGIASQASSHAAQSQSQSENVSTGKPCAATSRVDELIALKEQTALVEGYNKLADELSTMKQKLSQVSVCTISR
jgi:hypothetical protein